MTCRSLDVTHPAFGASPALADNIPAINAALAVANTLGGAEVCVPDGVFEVRPSSTSWIAIHSHTTLRLAPGAVIKVGDDTGSYPTIISGPTFGTLVERVRITGGLIDQNAAGNTTSDITPGVAAKHCHAIRFDNFDGVVVEGMTIYGCGVNTITCNGPTAHNVAILNCTFTFEQGASSVPDYDNSTLYLNASAMRVVGNRFTTQIVERARACCELHGEEGVMVGNVAANFQTLCNVVTHSGGSHPGPTGFVVADNTLVGGNNGIRLWADTGQTMRGVVVADNMLAIDQLGWNEHTAQGIDLTWDAVSGDLWGDYEDIAIHGNVIRFAGGDTRSVDRHGDPIDDGTLIGIGAAPGGDTAGLTIRDNVIRNAPAQGLRVGRGDRGDGTTTLVTDALIEHNTVIDAGGNPNLGARWSLVLGGDLTNVRMLHNHVRDTGSAALVGGQWFVATTPATGLGACTDVWLRDNDVSTASGLPIFPAIDTAKIQRGEGRNTVVVPNLITDDFFDLTVTVLGVKPDDFPVVHVAGGMLAGLGLEAWVSTTATDTVTIRVRNNTASTIPSQEYLFRVKMLPMQVDA